MIPYKKALTQLHLAVFLFGFIAVLGDLIELSSLIITWWRLLFSVITLFVFISFYSARFHLQKVKKYLVIGAIMGLQWLTFFGTVKLANASIAVVCISTGAFITSFLEPMLLKVKMDWNNMWISLLILPAMFLISHDLPQNMLLGVVIGLISAFLAALFSVLNKKHIDESVDVISITFWELVGGIIIITVAIIIYSFVGSSIQFHPKGNDWIYLLMLALACTGVGYVLFLSSLKHLSAYMANLVVNLEPVYGILLGAIVLQDYHELNGRFYVGALLIISTLFLPVVIRRWKSY